MILQYLLLFIFLIVIAKYLWTQRRYYSLAGKVHTVFGLPLIGVAHQIRNTENIIKYTTSVRDNCRKISNRMILLIWFGPTPIIGIGEPELAKKILLSPNFTNKLEMYHLANALNGLFVLQDAVWIKHRKLLDPAFNLQVLKSFLPIFNQQSDILIERLSRNINKGSFDTLKLVQICTLDITFQTTMGRAMNFQQNENSSLAEIYTTAIQKTTQRLINPLYHVDIFFKFTTLCKIIKSCESTIKTFVSELLTEKLNENKPAAKFDSEETKTHNIFIDQAFQLFQNNKFSWMEVIDESNGMIVAAFETTSNTITYAMILLAMFPEYQEKLFQELYNAFPQRDDFEVTYDDLKKLTYLDMVINETMRVMAPLPFVGRAAAEDFPITEDIIIPKGAQVVLDIFNMHRDEHFWGPKAKLFYPDHFLPENFKKVHPFAFLPFAKGERNCVGWRYGLLSIKIILAKIFRTYQLSTEFKFENLEFLYNLTIKLKQIPTVVIYKRDF